MNFLLGHPPSTLQIGVDHQECQECIEPLGLISTTLATVALSAQGYVVLFDKGGRFIFPLISLSKRFFCKVIIHKTLIMYVS